MVSSLGLMELLRVADPDPYVLLGLLYLSQARDWTPPWVRLILQWPPAEGGGRKGDTARGWEAVHSPGEASGPGVCVATALSP